MNQTNADEPVGYTPRKLNVYEQQIENDWDHDIASVLDLVDGWVRTVAVITDLTEFQIDRIVERISAAVTEFRERKYSAFAGVDEIRGQIITEIRRLMIEEGLDP